MRLAAGGAHTAVVVHGKLHLFGSNRAGQLGRGLPEEVERDECAGGETGGATQAAAVPFLALEAKRLGLDNDRGCVASVACGLAHTVAVLSNGATFAWGRNDEGQCDVPAPPRGSGPPACIHGQKYPGAMAKRFFLRGFHLRCGRYTAVAYPRLPCIP